MKQLLAIRKLLKSKKPTFTRQDAHKKVRVGTGWRKPKGRHNKMRLHKKSYAKGRSTGYGSPVAVKGLSAQGFTQNVVATLKNFESLNPKTDGIIIAGNAGGRKKIILMEFAEKNNFTILNLDAKVVKKSIDEKLAVKKAKKKELLKRKETKKAKEKLAKAKAEKKEEKSSEKASPTKDSETQKTEKDIKLEEKKEHDKVLIRGE